MAYLVEARGITSVLLPDYMCDAVYEEFMRHGVNVKTYSVTMKFEPDWAFSVERGQWLYLNDYYGQLNDSCIAKALEASEGRLIIDETQGYFERPREGIDTLYTCRKYFGVPDGGFLYTDATLSHPLERDVSWQRMKHVLGRLEEGSATFFADAQQNNDVFSGHGARAMSALTENLLRGIDYSYVAECREKNYGILAAELDDLNPLLLRTPIGPFAYPLLVKDGMHARKVLAARGVFVPTLWPNVLSDPRASEVALELAKNILPLPVDQRYGAVEMSHILVSLHEEGIV